MQRLQVRVHECRAFSFLFTLRRSKEPEISFISEAQFRELAPPELQVANPAASPHQYMLNRLAFELQQRKQYGFC